MSRAWFGLSLLAASWLVGLGYYHGTNWPLWAMAVLGGAALLWGA
jgi:hypothetical protein